MAWKGAETVTPVTFAFIDLANATPFRMALSDSAEPSVGIRMCLYMAFSLPTLGIRNLNARASDAPNAVPTQAIFAMKVAEIAGPVHEGPLKFSMERIVKGRGAGATHATGTPRCKDGALRRPPAGDPRA